MATIKDVAREAGVGVGTVSRVLSGRGAVAPETAARVRAAIAALDFRPSSIARALTRRRSGAVGLYVPSFETLFYGPLVRLIDDELRAADRHLVVTNGVGNSNPRGKALEAIDFLLARECDGLIIFSLDLTDDDFVAIQARCPHLVIVNRDVPALPGHCFAIDHGLGGRLAARALLGRGHRDIAVIAGPALQDSRARMDGFLQELRDHGTTVSPNWQVSGTFSIRSGDRAMDTLLAQDVSGCSAVFVANDSMAIGALARLCEAGVHVPDQLSVLGYDDAEMSGHTAPRLTTVHVPIREMTTAAVHDLLNRCYGLALPVERAFTPAVVWRASVGQGPHAVLDT